MRTGNAPAARGFLAELAQVPDDLKVALRAVELDDEKSQARKAHFETLEREFDPRIALRERVALFLTLAAAVLVVTVLPSLLPIWSTLTDWLGAWILVGKLLPFTLTLLVALAVGRKSLLGTRLNRRIILVLVFVLLSVTFNRIVCALLGVSRDQTLILDLVVGAALSSGPALLFHWGFFISLGCNLLGVAAALIWPEHVRWIYGAAVASALSGVLITWTTWRSEMTAPIDRAR